MKEARISLHDLMASEDHQAYVKEVLRKEGFDLQKDATQSFDHAANMVVFKQEE